MAIPPVTPGNDNITINQLFDLVLPSAGNDTVTDNDASPFSLDLVFGGAGNDTFVAGKGLNIFDGGAGIDTVDYKNASVGVNVDLASGIGLGDGLDILSGVENVTGSKFADTITGDAGANKINAGDGDDVVKAGAGDDVVNGEKGNDNIEGGAGNDALSGGLGNDQLRGQAGDDSISGGAGDDLVAGGPGKDLLDGGAGKDTINLGGGAPGDGSADTVFYNSSSESTAAASDTINGFVHGTDKIDLSSIDANVDQAGNQAFQYVAFDPTKPLEAGQVTSHFDAASGKTIVESFNGAETMHTELQGNVPMDQNDFVL